MVISTPRGRCDERVNLGVGEQSRDERVVELGLADDGAHVPADALLEFVARDGGEFPEMRLRRSAAIGSAVVGVIQSA